jgi:hypothetical protein
MKFPIGFFGYGLDIGGAHVGEVVEVDFACGLLV